MTGTMYQVKRNGQSIGLYAKRSTASIIVELNQKRDLRKLDSESVRKARYQITPKVVA